MQLELLEFNNLNVILSIMYNSNHLLNQNTTQFSNWKIVMDNFKFYVKLKETFTETFKLIQPVNVYNPVQKETIQKGLHGWEFIENDISIDYR